MENDINPTRLWFTEFSTGERSYINPAYIIGMVRMISVIQEGKRFTSIRTVSGEVFQAIETPERLTEDLYALEATAKKKVEELTGEQK